MIDFDFDDVHPLELPQAAREHLPTIWPIVPDGVDCGQCDTVDPVEY